MELVNRTKRYCLTLSDREAAAIHELMPTLSVVSGVRHAAIEYCRAFAAARQIIQDQLNEEMRDER